MILSGTRFGDIEYAPEDVLTFGDGLIGFGSAKRFVILSSNSDGPFRWLQSIEEPALAFLITEPGHFVEDYAPEMGTGAAAEIGITEPSQAIVFTTVNIPAGKPEEMTLNLAGPLVINAISRQGRQIVLEDEAYTIRHRVFVGTDQVSESAAA